MNVVVPGFNEAKHIPHFLENMAAQELVPQKITLVDDCSSDDSCDVFAKNIKKLGLKGDIIRNSSNIGPIRNFRIALSIIATDNRPSCFLSLHEEYYPNHIKTISEELAGRQNCATIYTPCDFRDLHSGRRLNFHSPNIDTQGLSSEAALEKVITNYTFAAPLWAHHNQLALRKSTPFPFNSGGDHALLASLALNGEIIFIPNVTYCRYFDTQRTQQSLLQFESSMADRNDPSPWRDTPWLSFWANHYNVILESHKSAQEQRQLLKIAASCIIKKSAEAILQEIEACKISPSKNIIATTAATSLTGALNF